MKKIAVLSFLCIILLLGGSVFYLFYNGLVWFNNPSHERFPVRGVDVSKYQGEIDWDVLAAQDLQFAFIKATEGSSHQDPMLEHNLEGVAKTGLKFGFYHFFSYDSPGSVQAENFIKAVPKIKGMLPPAVDVEFYGDNASAPVHPQIVFPILDALLAKLEAHYGATPILYATDKSYELYLRDRYARYPLWIRDVFRYPQLPDGARWTFWQYSDRQELEGYNGPERFIDMNVFYADADAFEKFVARGRVPPDTLQDDWADFDQQIDD